ncbi:MAG: hypothetical protein DI533_00600 [Cereibacter sphaeroides]|uniref:histidine kinase n=1 Tax=Cereibacter sphaeroides TaxID=1063 RepID=A0A2W5UMY8_CERSP|nr:MAG: hypothetical protein DI533_00600 [Cereibacter sphaeroides]
MTLAMTDKAVVAMPRGVALLRFGVPTLALVSALIWGNWTYREATEAALQRTSQGAALVNQYTERLVQTQTILQRAAVERARTEPPGFLQSQEFHSFLQQVTKTQGFIEGLVIVAFDGQIIASSGSYPINRNMGTRDYITAIANGAPLFVDRITLEPSSVDAVVVSTPFEIEGFRGVIVSAIGVETMRTFLTGLAAENGEHASLVREGGKVLIRNNAADATMLQPDGPMMQAISKGSSGSFTALSTTDGIRRFYAFQRVEGYPLYAVFGTAKKDVLISWLDRSVPVWAVLAAIAGFTFLTSGRIQRSIVRRVEAEQTRLRLDEAERLAEQRRRMMGEMNHRIKNNLAMVAALISMQLRSKGSVDGAELKSRIMAISEVHEFLYRAADSERMDFGTILKRISTSPAIVPEERGIRIELDVRPDIIVDPDHATALALCAAEVLTNSVKHAFPDRAAGTIRVSLHREGGEGVMEIADDGVGMPQHLERSSGLRIIDGLVAQVGGAVTRAGDHGMRVTIRFPLLQGS